MSTRRKLTTGSVAMAGGRSGRLQVGPIFARVVRPPGKTDTRPYWQAVVYEGDACRTVWSGRGTVDEVEGILSGIEKNSAFKDAVGARASKQVTPSVLDLGERRWEAAWRSFSAFAERELVAAGIVPPERAPDLRTWMESLWR